MSARLILGLAACAFFGASLAAQAQTYPQPDLDNPRIQTAYYSPVETIALAVLSGSGLTVALERGEQIRRIVIADQRAFDAKVAREGDSFLLLPLTEGLASTIDVETDRRIYRFDARPSNDLIAAYLVQLEYGASLAASEAGEPIPPPAPVGETWSYRLRGDRALQPASIADDGAKTFIHFAPDQALPAIFAIGPTGEEEVVNGHMRQDVFVIDRVHQELVFRIDKDRATAKRQSKRQSELGRWGKGHAG